MILTMLVTCATQHEKVEEQEVDNKRIGLIGRIREMKNNVTKVPVPIRRVCYGELSLPISSKVFTGTDPRSVVLAVQIFSWMALFPFLTYRSAFLLSCFRA